MTTPVAEPTAPLHRAPLPRSAVEHYARQQAITAAGVATAQNAYEQGDSRRVLAAVTLYQYLAARDAVDSLNETIEDQGIDPTPIANVIIAAFAGIASNGSPLQTILDAIGNIVDLIRVVTTEIQDAARTSAGVGIVARPAVTGYVRMLNPPSCNRCAILAGQFYRWSVGFARHPRCDCRHIPADENVAGDLTTDVEAYFDSLPSKAELDSAYPDMTVAQRREAGLFSQEDIFTNAGAQAIRDGADPGQVVNARSGMRTAGGNLRRNRAGQQITTAGIRRFGRNRLMPEGIYALAGEDRALALDLLRRWGYLTS